MIRISEKDLDVGLAILRAVQDCSNSIHCLWGKLVKNAEKECPLSNSRCPLIVFKKELEEESPAFMGFYQKAFNYDSVISEYSSMEQEGDSFQKEEVRKCLRDLYRFKQISLLSLFFLYSANGGKIPYCSKALIEEVSKDFSLGLTIKELWETNSKWVNFLDAHCFNLEHYQHQEYYKYHLYLLIKIFIQAIEEEKQELFKKIDEFLMIRRG